MTRELREALWNKNVKIARQGCGVCVIAAVALPLGACAPSTTPVIAVRYNSPDVEAQALIQGVLVVTGDGCVGIERSDGSVLTVVFPEGSTVSAGGKGVLIPKLGEIVIGSKINGSGAYADSSALADVAIPDQCGEGTFAVLES